MTIESERPIEVRMEARLETLKNKTRDLANQMRREGFPEVAIASFLFMHEQVNRLVREPGAPKDSLVAPQDRTWHTGFIYTMAAAVKALADCTRYGNVKGTKELRESLGRAAVDESNKQKPFYFESEGVTALADGIREALREATGKEPGQQGTRFVAEAGGERDKIV